MLITVEKPVYTRSFSGDTVLVRAFETSSGNFILQYQNSHSGFAYDGSINADNISFDKYIEPNINEDVISYLYDIGIKRISNLPTSMLVKLSEKHPTFSLMIECIKALNEDDVNELGIKPIDYHGKTVIMDKELDMICTDALIDYGKLNPLMVNLLSQRGIIVSQLNPELKDNIHTIETKSGLVLFG